MSLPVLVILIFLGTLGLILCGVYFFIEGPAAKTRLRKRIAVAKAEIAASDSTTLESELLRAEVLSDVPALHRFLTGIPGSQRLHLFIQQSATQITVGMVMTITFLIAWVVFLVCLLFDVSIILSLILAVLCGFIPFLIIAIKRQKRFLRFEELFPDAIDLLGRAVRAGHAFTTGLDLIAKEMPSPVSDEFQRVYEQQNLGLPLRDAFQNMMKRMPLPDVRIFVTALIIQRESGGNLAEILDNPSHVIRERFKLVRQIRVYTAQGRLSLYILVAVPPFMGVLVFFINREYIMRLFTDPLGIQMLVAGVILQTMGYFVIRKIIQPKF